MFGLTHWVVTVGIATAAGMQLATVGITARNAEDAGRRATKLDVFDGKTVTVLMVRREHVTVR